MVLSDVVSDLYHVRESSICVTTQGRLLEQIHTEALLYMHYDDT